MHYIILLLAIFGLAFTLKETDGPGGIINKLRNYLFTNKYVGVFFYQLFDCYACLGFHCGWIVYLLSGEPFKAQFIILWGLAGAATSIILDAGLSRLYSHD